MQSFEVTYETTISAKVTLSAATEKELRRDLELERGEDLEECYVSDYLEEVAEEINAAIKLPEKFKAANGCRVELEIDSTEQL
tara:strand:- start:844 stop:1092 length:249 start_codon:yes stop_codon:yes gene_type:complete